MENERTENIFYLDLKHVHKYGCAKFQPNPLFSSQQTATESAAEKKKKKKKKVGNPLRGSPITADIVVCGSFYGMWSTSFRLAVSSLMLSVL